MKMVMSKRHFEVLLQKSSNVASFIRNKIQFLLNNIHIYKNKQSYYFDNKFNEAEL